MAALYSAKECSICNEEFNEEERCPRSLPCSHCLCTDCINQLISRNKKSCPICRQYFKAKTANNIGINTSLLEVLKLLRTMEQNASSARIDEYKRENKDTLDSFFSKGRETLQQIESAIERNNAIQYNLQQNNIAIQTELKSTLKEIEANNFERMHYLSDQNHSLHNLKKVLIEKLKQAEETVKRHASSEITNTLAVDIQTCLQSFKDAELTEEKERKETEKAAKSMRHKISVIKELLNSSEEEGVPDQILTFSSLRIQDNGPVSVTVDTLRNQTKSTVELLRSGRIFALQQFEGRQRIARISLSENNKICLHRLKEDPLPSNVHTLEYSAVMRLVDRSSVVAFWDLSDVRRHYLGRMYIALKPRSKRADQFRLLCTGEIGRSYANTCCFGVKGKGEYSECAGFGDYEYLGGEGGKAVVPGVWQGEEEFSPWSAGIVQGSFPWEGEKKAAQVFIYTRYFNQGLPYCYGMVTEGLEVLSVAIAEYPNIQNVVINDCGLVLSV